MLGAATRVLRLTCDARESPMDHRSSAADASGSKFHEQPCRYRHTRAHAATLEHSKVREWLPAEARLETRDRRIVAKLRRGRRAEHEDARKRIVGQRLGGRTRH